MADDTKTVFAAPRPPYDTSPPPSIVATAETRISALIESLHRVSLHAHAHFASAEKIAAEESAKIKSEA
jgi:hypothetical protein